MRGSRPALFASILALATVLGGTPLVSDASEEGAGQTSPYVGFEKRPIKALSEERLAGYLEGQGMGFALAAELNRYPGPKHVIELAEGLELTAGQISATRQAYDTMHQRAVDLGERVVALERVLDRAFASGSLTEARLESLTAEIGRLESSLRFAHLRAHLEMRRVLNPEQISRYVELRGYGSDPSHGHPANCPHGGG